MADEILAFINLEQIYKDNIDQIFEEFGSKSKEQSPPADAS